MWKINKNRIDIFYIVSLPSAMYVIDKRLFFYGVQFSIIQFTQTRHILQLSWALFIFNSYSLFCVWQKDTTVKIENKDDGVCGTKYFLTKERIYTALLSYEQTAHKDVLSFRFHCWRTIFNSLEFFQHFFSILFHSSFHSYL